MTLSARDDKDGHAIDWWFMYKLPRNAKPPKGASEKPDPTTGYEYLYYDPRTEEPLAMSPHTLDTQKGALWHTLQQMHPDDLDARPGLGWILYNDEIPGTESNDGRKGHTKGVLAYDLDNDSAFWLLHSTPRFPHTDSADFPENEKIYGQTYLCITLDGVATARVIADIMRHQQEPQTYGCRVAAGLRDNDPLRLLAESVDPNETDPPADQSFHSKAGHKFRLLAKNRHWGEDFWIDWVGPRLHADLSVETWRRGTLPSTEDSDGVDETRDILYIDLSPLGAPYEWHYTKDHAKWATSDTGTWVCVGDINRQTSQEKRGGGAICFHHKALHDQLASIEKYQP